MSVEHTDHFARPFKIFSELPHSVRSELNSNGSSSRKVQDYLQQRKTEDELRVYHQVW